MNTLFLLIVAFIIGFVCSQAGVSGAFLLLPFQVSVLGFVTPSVNATNFLYNVISIPSGVYRYWREGRMIWILALIIIAGYLPGIYMGSLIRVDYLDSKTFKLFIGLVLLCIGIRLLFSASDKVEKFKMLKFKPKVVKIETNITRISFSFCDEEYSFSPFLMFLTALVIGVIGGAYGVGGGALMSPILVTLFKLPIHAIAGANLLGTFVASLVGVASFTALGYPPDFKVGLLLGVGGLAGIYAGARFQKFVAEKNVKMLLSFLILTLSAKYILQFWM